MVGLVVCSGPRSGHWVAPFGGLAGRLATNPIAYAFPRSGEPPVVADFSTSVAPEGVIRSLRNRGLPAPEGSLRDAAGQPTSDPAALYETPPGACSRSAARSAIAAPRSASSSTCWRRCSPTMRRRIRRAPAPTSRCWRSTPTRLFAEPRGAMGRYVKSAPPIDRAHPVLLPGEREQEIAASAGDGPVLVDGPTWAAMTAKAGDRIELPSPLPD